MRRILINDKDEFKCKLKSRSRNFAIKNLGRFYDAMEKKHAGVVISNNTSSKNIVP